MAKTEKQTTASKEFDVVDAIKAGSITTIDLADEALEEIKKDKQDRDKQELKEIVNRAMYKKLDVLLSLRQRRAEEKVTKASVTAKSDLLDRLVGKKVTISEKNEILFGDEIAEDQRVSPTEYTKLLREQELNDQKAMTEISKNFDECKRMLRKQYPWYCVSAWY